MNPEDVFVVRLSVSHDGSLLSFLQLFSAQYNTVHVMFADIVNAQRAASDG